MDTRDSIQLLPGTKKRLGIKVPGENRFLYIGSAILGAVLVVMFSMVRYEASLSDQLSDKNNQLVELEQKRNKKDEAELKLIKERLMATSGLIEDHLYWTQAFAWLENSLQRDVQIHNLILDPTGKVNIIGVASNYTAIARQIASFLTTDKVIEVSVGKMEVMVEGNVKFGLEVLVDLSKIIKK